MNETAETWLGRANIAFKRTTNNHLQLDCPHCGKAKHLHINNATSLWDCKRCGKSGGGRALQQALGLVLTLDGSITRSRGDDNHADKLAAKRLFAKGVVADVIRWADSLTDDKEAKHARDYLASREITMATARRVMLGWAPYTPNERGYSLTDDEREAIAESRKPRRRRRGGDDDADDAPAVFELPPGWLAIPIFSDTTSDGEIDVQSVELVKFRSVPPAERAFQRMRGGHSGLYKPAGKIDPTKPLLIVGGEIDAISVFQSGWTNVAAATVGEAAWPSYYNDELESFTDIVIALDDDEAGAIGTEKIVQALGAHRCRIAPKWREVNAWSAVPDDAGKYPKDANETLCRVGEESWTLDLISAWVAKSKVLASEGIITFGASRDDILAYLDDPNKLIGTPTPWADLTRVVGGFRDGEITVVTGMEGSGKSTWCSDLMLHEAIAGRPSFIMPLELGYKRQVLKTLRQVIGESPAKVPRETLQQAFDAHAALPLIIGQKHGRMSPELMRNTIKYVVEKHNVRNVLLDHLHFAIDESRDSHVHIDAMMKALTDVVLETQVRLYCVAHPHAVKAQGDDRDNVIVQASDLKGGSSIKQVADNIYSLHRYRSAARTQKAALPGHMAVTLHVLKNRGDEGNEGNVPLLFNLRSSRYVDFVGKATTESRHRNAPDPRVGDDDDSPLF